MGNCNLDVRNIFEVVNKKKFTKRNLSWQIEANNVEIGLARKKLLKQLLLKQYCSSILGQNLLSLSLIISSL